jgi:3-dehydroquinate dehydratase/shikimate dehydrogenase
MIRAGLPRMNSPSRLNLRLLRHRLPKVCVAIVASNPAEMVQKAERVVRDNLLIEFRLDYISKPGLALPKLRQFLETRPHVIAVATCRRAAAGGKFKGSIAAQVDVLLKAAAAGCQLVDVELQTVEKLKTSEWNKVRNHTGTIVSYHDFRGTKKLAETYARMTKYEPDFVKVVSTATCLADNVTMIKFLEAHSDDRSTIGLCMGEQGIISRVLGLRAGSAFTFAAAGKGEETAPGQIAARTLEETFRIEQVEASTRVYGVAGDPVSHSLSPVLMNAAFRRETINAVYLALHAKQLSDLLQLIRQIPIHGVSITMPYKEKIMKYLDGTDALSTRIGACNTVVRSQDGKLYGYNTDVAGVLRPIEQRINIPASRFLVIGAGGAARAAVFGLKERGAEVYVMNRAPAAAQALARQARARTLKRQQLAKMEFDVIINATPAGMKGDKEPPPISDKELKTRYVFDMVYSPAETRLVKIARAQGLHVISGAEMFVHQAARQFEIWTGKPAPVDDMQRVVAHQLAAMAAQKNGTPAKQ